MRESGMTQPAIAEVMGVSLSTVNRVHMAYDSGGVKALKPKPSGGRQRENMSVAQEKALLTRYTKAAGAGELLNIHDLKAAYEKAIGHSTSNSTIYNLLVRHNWRKLSKRPMCRPGPCLASAGSGRDLRHSGHPPPWKQFLDPVDRVVGDAREDIAQSFGWSPLSLADYAARRTMPNGSRATHRCRGTVGRHAVVRSVPIRHSFGRSERFKEGEQAVVGTKADLLAAPVRL